MKNLNIIIPAAGLGRRMKSYGSKCLISLGKETVIERQIRIIKEVFPHSNIYVVMGFEYEKVKKSLPSDIRCVKNSKYETTNVAYSINAALKNIKRGPVMIIYGDLIFNNAALESVQMQSSNLLIYNQNREDEVGVHAINNEVVCLDYGLPNKWGHIAFLNLNERLAFEKYAIENDKLFTFEIFNKIINNGGKFTVSSNPEILIAEIDSSKDIDFAKKIAKS